MCEIFSQISYYMSMPIVLVTCFCMCMFSLGNTHSSTSRIRDNTDVSFDDESDDNDVSTGLCRKRNLSRNVFKLFSLNDYVTDSSNKLGMNTILENVRNYPVCQYVIQNTIICIN